MSFGEIQIWLKCREQRVNSTEVQRNTHHLFCKDRREKVAGDDGQLFVHRKPKRNSASNR